MVLTKERELNSVQIDKINEVLGRTPSEDELSVFTLLWSPENLMSSKAYLNQLIGKDLVDNQNGVCISSNVNGFQSNEFINQIFTNSAQGDIKSIKNGAIANQLSFCNEISGENLVNSFGLTQDQNDEILKSEFRESLASITSLDEILNNLPENVLEIGLEFLPKANNESQENDATCDIDAIPEPKDLKEVAISLLQNENIASQAWANKQINTDFTEKFSEAHLIPDGKKLLSLSSNPNYSAISVQNATKIALVESIRKQVISGATADAVSLAFNTSNCNESKNIISDVCKTFGVKVANLDCQSSANIDIVSAGAIGQISDSKAMSYDFKSKGDLIFILGQSSDCVSASEYLKSFHKIESNHTPKLDLQTEKNLHQGISELIAKEYVNAAHSISRGGLFVTLAEMAMASDLGFDIVTDSEVREDAFLFGEAQSRVIVGVSEDQEDEFIEFMMQSGVPFTLLGHVTKGKMVIDDMHYGFINEMKDIYEHALENILS